LLQDQGPRLIAEVLVSHELEGVGAGRRWCCCDPYSRGSRLVQRASCDLLNHGTQRPHQPPSRVEMGVLSMDPGRGLCWVHGVPVSLCCRRNARNGIAGPTSLVASCPACRLALWRLSSLLPRATSSTFTTRSSCLTVTHTRAHRIRMPLPITATPTRS